MDQRQDRREASRLDMERVLVSTRLAQGGRLIDRTKTLKFRFNDKYYSGVEGDTLASALLANDQMLIGRSFKYHRPRGFVASGAEEPNGIFNMAEGHSHHRLGRVEHLAHAAQPPTHPSPPRVSSMALPFVT